MFARTLLALSLAAPVAFALAPDAHAAEVKLATVDFQRALDNVAEGAAAKKKLETAFQGKKVALEKMQTNLQTMVADYEKQSMLLSDAARKEKEEAINVANAQLQQAAAVSEGEMQQQYASVMEALITKMKQITTGIATERAYTLVVEINEGGVVYGSAAIDITDELIKRYNAQNPVK